LLTSYARPEKKDLEVVAELEAILEEQNN